ncbi:hypothetical protein GC167_00955 [bacterium]|nr:hypothetical protein [bacterium]
MKQLALIISGIVHPVLAPLLGCLVLMQLQSTSDQNLTGGEFAGVFVLSLGIPLAVMLWLKQTGRIESIHMGVARDRRIPLVVAAATQVVVALLLRWKGHQSDIPDWFLGIGLCLALFAALLPLLKASVHMAGVGTLQALWWVESTRHSFNPISGLVGLMFAAAVVAWARAELKAHTGIELLVGWLASMGCVAFALWF